MLLLGSLFLTFLVCYALSAAPVVNVENFPLTYEYYNSYQSTQFINDTAILLSKAATVTDADSDNIQTAVIQITHGLISGDTLSYTDVSPIVGVYSPEDGKLTLTGPTTAANFQVALRSIYFKATETYHLLDVPNKHNKLVSFKVTDVNSDASAIDNRAINITGATRVYTEGVPLIAQVN
mmetsp:Transcript_19503/g.40690  ORF Transcript_19503/g.40690 Transcript_19503/m.40690 type:complete len:180 (-) Transcript_19503:32-571(-)